MEWNVQVEKETERGKGICEEEEKEGEEEKGRIREVIIVEEGMEIIG